MNSKKAIAKVEWDEYSMLVKEHAGFCTACCEWEDDGRWFEPDARNFRCSVCGGMTVFGAEEVVLKGLVEVVLSFDVKSAGELVASCDGCGTVDIVWKHEHEAEGEQELCKNCIAYLTEKGRLTDQAKAGEEEAGWDPNP